MNIIHLSVTSLYVTTGQPREFSAKFYDPGKPDHGRHSLVLKDRVYYILIAEYRGRTWYGMVAYCYFEGPFAQPVGVRMRDSKCCNENPCLMFADGVVGIEAIVAKLFDLNDRFMAVW